MDAARQKREQAESEPAVADAGKGRATIASRIMWPLTLKVHSPAVRLDQGLASGRPGAPPFIQTKLTVGAPGDQYEQEADRVADMVMRMPDPAIRLQRKCGCGGSGASCECREQPPLIRRKTSGAQTGLAATAPPIVHDVVRSPGQPLSQSTRTFFESRFNHDFSRVRVHVGGQATESARRIGARAYTVNDHIVFGPGEYAPGSSGGGKLLAHELAHVMQQDGSAAGGVVQRAEVDDRSCSGLTDIESDVNTKVNSEIAGARSSAVSPMDLGLFLKDVATRLGGFTPVSPIEQFIEALPATKRTIPPNSLAGTKYSGVGAVNQFYKLQTLGLAHVVGSAAKVKGVCIGADKLGHFFEEGFMYFVITVRPGGSKAKAESAGGAFEIGVQGLASTGVFSNADRAANLAGSQFYKDLATAPTSFTFAIKDYITSAWNEQSNPSFYEKDVATVVWKNLLDGTWKGSFTSAGGTSTPIDAIVTLLATTGGDVTGTNQWPAAKPTMVEKIKNGKITQKTTSVAGEQPGRAPVSASPVSGVSIDFDWEAKSASGKGTWTSVDEQTLTGTWGIGTSRTNGGTWSLKKT